MRTRFEGRGRSARAPGRAAPLVIVAVLALAGCDKGDWFPFERTARELFNGWDMWDTAAVSPHKTPMPPSPAGVVPVGGRLQTYDRAAAELARLDLAARRARGQLAYRRYCHHCHGPAGDGRSIVGESFAPSIPDLRAVTQTDRELFDVIMGGGGNMLPLASTLSALEAVLTISHVRALAGAPSRPVYAPKDTAPVR